MSKVEEKLKSIKLLTNKNRLRKRKYNWKTFLECTTRPFSARADSLYTKTKAVAIHSEI